MKEFYGVIITTPRPVPTVDDVEIELVKLRAKYPDVTSEYIDEKGEKYTNIVYGKYSELGMCTEPFEDIGGTE